MQPVHRRIGDVEDKDARQIRTTTADHLQDPAADLVGEGVVLTAELCAPMPLDVLCHPMRTSKRGAVLVLRRVVAASLEAENGTKLLPANVRPAKEQQLSLIDAGTGDRIDPKKLQVAGNIMVFGLP